MTKAEQFPLVPAMVSQAIFTLGASSLIFSGLVFELRRLAEGQAGFGLPWALSATAEGIWSVLVAQISAPALHTVLDSWPLLLITAGLAILPALRLVRGSGAAQRSRIEDKNGA